MPRLKADWIDPKPCKAQRVVKRLVDGVEHNAIETYLCYHPRWKDAPLKPKVFRVCCGCGVKAYQPNYIPRAYTLEQTMYQDDLAARGGVTKQGQAASLWDESTITANTKQKVGKTGKTYTPRMPKRFNQAVVG